jgi:hypothetical protein
VGWSHDSEFAPQGRTVQRCAKSSQKLPVIIFSMGFIHTGCYKTSPTAAQYADERARLHSWSDIHSVGAHDGTCVACKYSFGGKHAAALWCDRSIFQMSAIAQSSGWYFSNRHIELFL